MNSKPVFFLIIFILIISTGLWFWKVAWEDRQEYYQLKQNLVELETKLESLNVERSNYPAVKNAYAQKGFDFDTLKLHMPSKSENRKSDSYIIMLNEIRQFALERNIEVISYTPDIVDSYPSIQNKLELTDKHVERYMVKLNCKGKYLSFGAFFEDLRSLDYFINLAQFSISTDYETGGLLNCEATLYTYMFLEDRKS